MFESEQTIPMPSPSPARIVLDNLLNQLSVSTDSTLENVSFFWYRTQICLCSSLKHEGLLNHLYFPQRFGTCGWCGCLSCCSSQKHIWLLFVIICCQKLFLLCMKQSDYITLSRTKHSTFSDEPQCKIKHSLLPVSAVTSSPWQQHTLSYK